MTVPVMTMPLPLTGHPVQRCGAWSMTLLAGREHPDEVSVDDLESVAGQLVDDVLDHPRTMLRDLAADIRAGRHDAWFDDPLR